MQQNKINKIAVIALLFSLLSLAGSGIINNYYSCGNCTNGTNETTINYSLVYYKNETYNKLEINTSLELKLNKTGGNLTGNLTNISIRGDMKFIGENNLVTQSDAIMGQFNTLDVNGITYYFYITNRLWDSKTFSVVNGTYPARKGGQLSMKNALIEYRTFEPNSTANTIRWQYDDVNDVFIILTGTIKINSLVGAGNRPLCADPTGKVIIC